MTNEKNEVDRRAAPSSSADELPPLPAGLCRDDTEHDVEYFTAEQYREGQQQAYAIGRGAAVRDYISPKGAIQAAAPADAPSDLLALGTKMAAWLYGLSKAALPYESWATRCKEFSDEWDRASSMAILTAPAEDAREQQPDDADNLSVMLWLLRRLPRAYGNPPFVEQAINRLAKRTVTDVADSFAERNESCRATGTDRAQAGEAPAGVKEEGKEG